MYCAASYFPSCQHVDPLNGGITSRLERGKRLDFEVNPRSGVLERVLLTHRASAVPNRLQA